MSSLPQRESLAEQVADLIRGSAALREEIADELADHLASHAEESGIRDPRAAMGEAVEAFGDPKQVARELRAVHLGGSIMFQRIMMVALVILVVGLCGIAYMSWNSARRMDDQLAGLRKQLAEVQSRQNQPGTAGTRPENERGPKIRVYCFDAPPEKPVAGCKVRIRKMETINDEGYSGGGGSRGRGDRGSDGGRGRKLTWWSSEVKLQTDEGGWVDTGSLAYGQYEIDVGEGRWHQNIELGRPGQVEELRFIMTSHYKHTVRFDLFDEVTWDRERMREVRLSFSGPDSWWGGNSHCKPFEPCPVQGLVAGMRVNPVIELLGSPRKETRGGQVVTVEGNKTWVWHSGLTVPADGETIALRPKPWAPPGAGSGNPLRGILCDGSPDHPLANIPLVAFSSQASPGPLTLSDARCIEYLRSDAKGRFGTLSNQVGAVEMEYKTVDGKPGLLIWPMEIDLPTIAGGEGQAPRALLDVSKLATVRVGIADWDRLAGNGLRLVVAPQLIWEGWVAPMKRGVRRQFSVVRNWPTDAQGQPATSCDALVPAGMHDFRVAIRVEGIGRRQELPCVFREVEAAAGRLVELRASVDSLVNPQRARTRPASGRAASGPSGERSDRRGQRGIEGGEWRIEKEELAHRSHG